ncbi:hypothetical protein Q8F55_003179 [Vanrija albida]|uniref:Major facilitator superfamily (MFS) profile domain-containing protein n=1 Tax=Vanrija albida TaxID=181172 RepID=A0ABR3QBQ9_9TREE
MTRDLDPPTPGSSSERTPLLAGTPLKPGTPVDRHLAIQLPPSLVGFDDAALERMDRSVTRKVDTLLLPILIVLYILNFIDRNNVATANIGGMTLDLGMSSTDFSTAVAVLFISYISFQVPSNIIAARTSRPGIYICIMCALWGAVSACTGAVRSFRGLVVCRLLLGVTEAAFFPGAMFLLTLFYTKKQMALRAAILYTGSQFGNAFGGLFALACMQLEGYRGLRGWRWLFIVEGLLTVAAAFVFALIIPNRPESFGWLTEVERDRLQYVLEKDRYTKDAGDEIGAWDAFKLAVTDAKVWFVAAALTCNYIASGVVNFFPMVVKGLGCSDTVTLWLTSPPYLLCAVVISVVGWHSDKVQERTMHVVVSFVVCIAAMSLALATTSFAPRYLAMMIMPSSFYSASIVMLSWMSSSIVGPSVKRAIAIALINSIDNSPNVWTPYLYFDPPRYTVAFIVNLVASVALIVVVLAKRRYLVQQNRKLDRGEDLGPNGPTRVQIEAGFRFQL